MGKLAVRNMSAVEGAGAEAAAVKHPVYQGFEAHRDGSYQGIIPPQSKTFHGSRFPMLAEFLKGKGWKLAAAGQVADLSFQPEAKWQNESATEKPARVCLLSRAITDLMSNKRSFARALSTAGCAELTPETYLDVDEWESMMKLPENAEAGVLYFLKMANGSWGSDVHPVRTIDHVYQKIGADAAGMLKLSAMPGMPRAASVLPMAVLDAMKQELITGAAAVDPKVLEQAFANAFVNAIPPAKMATAKKSYLIQKGVEKPLLVNGGRKYVLRIYVVAVLRPTSGVGSKPNLRTRLTGSCHGRLRCTAVTWRSAARRSCLMIQTPMTSTHRSGTPKTCTYPPPTEVNSRRPDGQTSSSLKSRAQFSGCSPIASLCKTNQRTARYTQRERSSRNTLDGNEQTQSPCPAQSILPAVVCPFSGSII